MLIYCFVQGTLRSSCCGPSWSRRRRRWRECWLRWPASTCPTSDSNPRRRWAHIILYNHVYCTWPTMPSKHIWSNFVLWYLDMILTSLNDIIMCFRNLRNPLQKEALMILRRKETLNMKNNKWMISDILETIIKMIRKICKENVAAAMESTHYWKQHY